ncbi:hypothetical protein [Stenotrophomonas sp.]|uniref:hypothetical protein n=1 Tax=Stenotrophomonas sp. TaxID=69392 RepID=UPI0028A8A40D|nr:hypothetical protein [Stenotrophomonas sp.]
MKTAGFHRTLRGTLSGHSFVITVTSEEDDVFSYGAVVDGLPVAVRTEGVIRNKGDAMQLAITAIERYIGSLPAIEDGAGSPSGGA